MVRLRPARLRSRREALALALELVGLTVFVLVVYVVVVLGGGAVIGRTESPNVVLSVIATAIVAVEFQPVQDALERWALRVVHGGVTSPYDVLSQFSNAVTATYAAEELPVRMAKVLADGTGAEAAEVWLMVDGRLSLAARWPMEMQFRHDQPSDGPREEVEAAGRRSLSVRQAGQLLGVLVVQERENVPLTAVEEQLFAGLADQAGLVLQGARLRAELSRRLDELSIRADELRESRQRLVDAQDAERSRLERDIHDGAQQHLVALAVNLRLAHTLMDRSPERAEQILAEQEHAAHETVETLLSLSRGIYPRLLSDEGLPAALRAAAATSLLPVAVRDIDVGRYPANIEAALYFCALEAMQNAAKHSGASTVHVVVAGGLGLLTLIVEDDGAGFDVAAARSGAGLANMRDRIGAVGGELALESRPDGGTKITVRLQTAQLSGMAVT
jgi:signal transduction histidine kinase